MEATPVAHNAGEYRGFALAQLRILSDYCRRYKLNIASRKVELTNGVIVVCQVCYNKEDVWVKIPPVPAVTLEIVSEEIIHGFLAHPRNGTVRGFQFPGHDSARTPTYGIAHTGKGYKQENDTLTDLGDETGVQTGTPYPLADDRSTVYHFEYVDGEWRAAGPQELVYGNVDWKGPATDNPADRKILTYKGNPSRYWPVDQFVEIPGLSSVDHSVSGFINSYEYMTVFGDKVYSGGRVLAVMPWLYHPINTNDGIVEANHQNAQVLGAAYRESDGRLICVVKTCYNSYPDVKPAPPAEASMVSTWQVWSNGILVKDWYGDKAGAEQFCAENTGHTLVEVSDPGRGYWIEVLLQKSGNVAGGWTRLLREPTGAAWANCNFFFSADGTKATSVQLQKIWKIEIAPDDTATCTKTDVGKFQNTISATKTNTSESVPWSNDGITIIAKSGDYKDHGKEVRDYSAIKSGEIVIASDYTGNEYKELKATISGGDVFKKTQIISKYWGETAFVPDTEDTNRRIFNGINPAVWISLEGFPQGGGHLGNLSGACKPTCSVGLTNMSLHTSGEGDSHCNDTYSINSSCVQTGKAEACIEVTVTAANGTAYRKDCILMSGFGTWEGESISSNWYWDEEPIGATKIRHYVFEWVNPGYDMCSNGRCAEEAARHGATILSCKPGYCYYEKQVMLTYMCN